MKKILLSAAAIAMCTGLAFAQQQTTTTQQKTRSAQVENRRAKMHKMSPEEIAETKTNRLDKTVTLTDAQKQQIKSIYLAEAKETKERMAQRKETQEKVEALLTKEQAQKLDAAKQKKMEQMRTMHAERKAKAKQ